VIEASTDSEWVARCLEALGHEVIVADPNFAPMYATRSRKVKTDRRDIIQRVQGLPLPGRLRSVVAPLLAVMRPLNQPLAYSDTMIEHLAVQDPRVPRLRSVPRIGPVPAAAFLAAIDDAARFPHAHQLEADLGLVPREYSSGDSQRRGPITTAGHSRVRWLLIQAAVSILRRRPPRPRPSGPGPCASPAAGASTSPSSRSPAAWPAFSTRSSGTARCMRPAPRWRPFHPLSLRSTREHPPRMRRD
jgi:transposase